MAHERPTTPVAARLRHCRPDYSFGLYRREARVSPPFGMLLPAGYVIERELGRGAMGVVYLVRSLALLRPCAMKMILSGAHSSSAEVERFRTEAQAIARLQHPGIVQVFEVGEHDGRPFMALEYCS